MKTLVGLDALEPFEQGSAVAIGTFDGVHLGHRALIAAAAARAATDGLASGVVTWDRHPAQTLRPDKAPPMLSSPERKLELLEHTGIDFVALLPFDEDFATWPPERFVSDVLVAGLNVNFVSVGQGWRFGHRAQGDLDLLDALGVEAGFTVRAAPLVEARGEPISSNRIRKLIAAGDLELAAELLGRVFDVQGRVVHGDQRGASLGFPTANVALPAGLVTPPTGVYAGRAWLGGSATPALLAAINIGVNPTFEAAPEPRLEAYLLDFDGDLYGSELRVELVRKLREEQAFESADALIEQIKLDVGATRDLLQR